MDGLALLCNLHADGPLTLRRLRQAGIRSLGELERAPRESLASVLRASSHQARRFLYEAALLRRRIESDGEASSLPRAKPHTVAAEGSMGDAFHFASRAEDRPAPDSGGSSSSEAAAGKVRPFKLPRNARRPVGFDTGGGVAERVGKRGALCLPAPGPQAPMHEAAAPTEADIESMVVVPLPVPRATPVPVTPPRTTSPARAPHLPHEVVSVQGTLLRHGEIPGLDAPTLERLIAQGVRTYRSLVDLASLPLARRSGIPYTRLLDLRYHARRFLVRRLFPRGELSAFLPGTPGAAPLQEVVLTPERRPEPAPEPRRTTEPQGSKRTDRSYDVERPDPLSPESFTIGGKKPSSPGIGGPFV